MVSKYRRDGRSEKEFAANISESSLIERLLIRIVAADLGRISKTQWLYIDNGCDNYGSKLKNSETTTEADFQLIDSTGQIHKVDIKYSRPDRPSFHIKKNHIISYKKQKCIIIMFMGINTPNIRYTMIHPESYDKILKTGKEKILWGKAQFELMTKDFEWYPV